MKRALQIAVSLLVSAAALAYALRGVDFAGCAAALRAANPIWLVAMALLAWLALVARGRRWAVLLRTLGPLGDTPVLDATNIGFMGNMVLPLRAGEILRPLVVARAGRVTMPAALATVALDRLLDMVMLAVFAALALALVPAGDTLGRAAHSVVALVFVVVVLLVVTIRFAGWVELRLLAMSGRLPPILARFVREGGRGFLRSLQGLRDPATLLPALCWSFLVWLIAALGFSAGALALHIDAPALPLGVVTAVVVAAAVSVPSAPGFIGVFQAGSSMALALFAVEDSDVRFAFGMLTWLIQMVVIVPLGLWSLARLKLTFADLASAAKSGEPAT